MGRLREKGVLVYPVYSRRSGGLSVGINLFPDRKHCSFDCPYCEVFPFSTDAAFSLEQMERDLRAVLDSAKERSEIVKDICFSGSGEPSLSPRFPGALKLAARVRDEAVPSAALVIITNGMGLLEQGTFSLLREAAAFLDVWLKLDAGTPAWYQKINAGAIPHDKLTAKIKEFAALAPVTIQTMLCAVDGEKPPQDEERAWEKLVLELAATNGTVRKVQIYGKARPSPSDPKATPLPVEYLERRAASLRQALGSIAGERRPAAIPPVKVYP
ncbi:MAG: hypothetical protein FWB79_00380 [Treponema sp.]|nr:hypothetical protein [Treponema sp.]